MKATAVPAIEHRSSSTALHAGKQGHTAFFGPAAENEAPFFAPRIQTKLTIGRPGDKYEQEADAVADRVVQRLANPGAAVAVQKKCQDCEEKEKLQRKEEEEEREAPEVMRKEAEEEEEEAPPVQAKEKEEEEKPGIMRQAGPEEEEPLQAKAEAGASTTTPSLQSRLSSAKGSGAAMDKNTRQPMESAFGQDFGRVRIHTDSSSAQMNRELNARAFTHGRDIYFNTGEYSPGSTEGRRLLAHELVHVGQQGLLSLRSIQAQRAPAISGIRIVPSTPTTTAKLCFSNWRLGESKCNILRSKLVFPLYIEADQYYPSRWLWFSTDVPLISLDTKQILYLIKLINKELIKFTTSNKKTYIYVNSLNAAYESLQKEFIRRSRHIGGGANTLKNGIGVWSNRDWDWAALKGIEQLGYNIISKVPIDISTYCTKSMYAQLDSFKKHLFWVYFISCLSKYESGCNPNKKFRESFGVVSRGLLQISIESAKDSRYVCSEISRSSDLNDPIKNIKCGIRILNYWIGKDNKIGGDKNRNISGGGQYWSLLRHKVRYKGRVYYNVDKIANCVKQFLYC